MSEAFTAVLNSRQIGRTNSDEGTPWVRRQMVSDTDENDFSFDNLV